MDDALDRVFIERDPQPEGPHGWLQWKGTAACIDIYCACGAFGHVDAEFLYFLRCAQCGRTYHTSGYVRLIALTPEEAALVGPPNPVKAMVFGDCAQEED